MTKQEPTDAGSMYEDLDATIAELAEQETAYKARVRQTDLRRKREQEADPHFPG